MTSPTATDAAPKRVHVFSDVAPPLFLKQFPGMEPELEGLHFSFGLTPPDGADVLIVYTRASYSIPTTLPRERTVFLAAEPDVIHPYSTGFLNQFGIVLSGTDKPLSTTQWRTACCTLWFAGIDFSMAGPTGGWANLKGYDWFRALERPEQADRISIVTSNKSFTPYHQKRLRFIEALCDRIPDHLEIFGRGFRSVDDKKDALLPYRYHLAIENGDGPDLWTEKLADPFLCWTFPFYAGCTNPGDYFPRRSYCEIDLDRPHEMAGHMIRLMENGHYDAVVRDLAEARNRILEDYNAARLLVRLARAALDTPVAAITGPRLIRSERSLRPEAGARGSLPEWALRRTLLAIDPRAELRFAALVGRLQTWRSKRRMLKTERTEAARTAPPSE